MFWFEFAVGTFTTILANCLTRKIKIGMVALKTVTTPLTGEEVMHICLRLLTLLEP